MAIIMVGTSMPEKRPLFFLAFGESNVTPYYCSNYLCSAGNVINLTDGRQISRAEPHF
jgi:hypothetical protein